MAVGAAAGILIAAAGKRREADARTAYLDSFRYILEGDPDAAIEALALSRPGGGSATATGVALGALFRKKGDWSRAIRIHESLLRSPSLSPAWKQTLALELGLDFRGAGMISQATEVLERLVAQDPGHREALLLLRQMSEEGGDWEKALRYHEAWERSAGPSPSIRSHLLAFLSRSHLEAGRIVEAEEALRRAREIAPGCSDVGLAEAELATFRGEGERALAIASRILDDRPGLLFRILPLVERVDAGGEEAFLRRRLSLRPNDRYLRLAWARLLREKGEGKEAAATLCALLEEDPRWIEARQDLGRILLEDGDAREVGAHLGSILLESSRSRRPFQCGRCEVELAEPWFRCPRCFSWDTIEEAPVPMGLPSGA